MINIAIAIFVKNPIRRVFPDLVTYLDLQMDLRHFELDYNRFAGMVLNLAEIMSVLITVAVDRLYN